MKKILIALGGNALGKTNDEQKKAVKIAAVTIVDLYLEGNSIVVVHGNGPQVGKINNAFINSNKLDVNSEVMPFAESGSMSQGYIGFHIQNAIKNELNKRKIIADVASIITQTVVDINSESFNNPTKPIGDFINDKLLLDKSIENGWTMKEDSGRGWRRVVASPRPLDIVEKNIIKKLSSSQMILIAGGGGGIPVYLKDNEYIGIDAVIDKDFTASKIAELIDADIFMILTAVDKILINFGRDDEEAIDSINVSDLKKLIKKGEFPPGSMGPKVQAIAEFVEKTKKTSYIAKLDLAKNVLSGKSGTKITYK